MSRKGKLDLGIKSHGVVGHGHKVKVVKGEGSTDFPFPDDLVERAIKRAKGKVINADEKEGTTGDAEKTGTDSFLFKRGLWDIIKPAVPKVRNPDFQRLINGSDGIQGRIIDRQLDAILEQLFSGIEGGIAYALGAFGPRFQKPLSDHQRQVALLRQKVTEALPQVLKELAQRNPKVPVPQLLAHALELLMQELAPLLSVLNIYNDVFRQYQDGRFSRDLRALNQYMECCFHLNQSPDLPTSAFKVGDLLLSGFGGPGLGTIPGAKGPIGLHLLLMPFDMRDWMSVARPLLAHESRHQVFADIAPLERELQRKLRTNILRDTGAGGTIKLSSEKTRVGRYNVDTRDLLVKLITDCIGEIDADICGGVLFTGPSFLYSMLLSFPAMLTRTGRVKDAKQLLRTSSVYSMVPQEDNSFALEFESHPPDWIRVHIVAAALEEIGYKAEAAKLVELADEAVGDMPEFLTWKDSEGKSSTVVSIRASDIKAITRTVARTIIREPLPDSLGGKSNGDIVMWTPQRQAKVDILSATLLEGKATVPTDKGTILETYVGAAGAKAFWDGLATRTVDEILPGLEANTLQMIESLRPAA